MEIKNTIYKLRITAKMSQEDFASKFNVSRQSVQKWESGLSVPDISKIIEISKYFDISLDTLILGRGKRLVEELSYDKIIKPQYASIHDWEFYPSTLNIEYKQSVEEGLDIEVYKDVFDAAERLPKMKSKTKSEMFCLRLL